MKARSISSRNNPRFKSLSKLLKGTGIRKHGKALLSGPKQVLEVLRDFPHCCESVIVPATAHETFAAPSEGVDQIRLAPELFRELDVFGTRHFMLVVQIPVMGRWNDRSVPPGCTLFVPFQDPANVGTVIRSAAGLGASRVVMLQEAAHPFHPKALKAGGSAVFRIPITAGPPMDELESETLPIIGLSAGGRDLATFRFPEAFGLLPGLEGPGLPDNLNLSAVVGINMASGTESLNGALAAGIALYAWRSGVRRSRESATKAS